MGIGWLTAPQSITKLRIDDPVTFEFSRLKKQPVKPGKKSTKVCVATSQLEHALTLPRNLLTTFSSAFVQRQALKLADSSRTMPNGFQSCWTLVS